MGRFVCWLNEMVAWPRRYAVSLILMGWIVGWLMGSVVFGVIR